MVWSSAQQHNVDDMVAKCFDSDGVSGSGDVLKLEMEPGRDERKLAVGRKKGRNNLVAIWARDMLGLTQEEFSEFSSFSFLKTILVRALALTEIAFDGMLHAISRYISALTGVFPIYVIFKRDSVIFHVPSDL